MKTTCLHSLCASDVLSLICVWTASQCLVFIHYLFVHGVVHPTDKFFRAKGPVKYDLSEGCALCSRILTKYLLYEPHNYQLNGICPVSLGTLASNSSRSSDNSASVFSRCEIDASRVLIHAKQLLRFGDT
jgi:hypothetical protein